jgi:PAS domain S-box-containing protein
MSDVKQKTILLVEDEAIIAMAQTQQLEKEGYSVIQALSGEKAIDIICKTKEPIDLILMDIDLGKGIDGAETAREILREYNIPIMFLSSHIEKEIVEKTEKITSYGYMVKNSGITVLDASIKMALKLFNAHEALRESAERFKIVARATNDTVWDWDLATNALWWNEGMCTVFGYSAEEIEPTIDSWSQRLHPDDLDMVVSSIHALIDSGGQFWSSEYRFRRADRSYAYVLDRGFVMRDEQGKALCMIGAMLDVSERKRAESQREAALEALRESAYNLSALAENAHAGILVALANGHHVYANKRAAEITGYSVAELLEINMRHLAYPDEVKKLTELLQQRITGESASKQYETLIVNKDGKPIPVDVTGARTVWQGQSADIVIFHDITERKRVEEKIHALLQEKELLLKETHHHIKNNMTVINSLLSLQASAQENEACKNILNDAATRIKSMEVLYNKLYRSENFHELSIKVFLPPLIDEIVGVFYAIPPVKTIAHCEDFVLSAEILSALGIIINELITNSMKYAFKKSKRGLITVTVSKKDKAVTIIYEDNGIGLSESLSFENSSTFGLKLVAMLVKQINGSITIERKKRTRFIIEFEVY